MARKNVKVEIPISSPDDMATLVNNILSTHQLLGQNSPLTGEVNMLDLEAKHTLSVTKRTEGNSQHANAEADMQIAHTAMGTAEGQDIYTSGTVYNLTGLVRDRLLYINKGMEEELGRWGFNVVISDKKGIKTVSIEIPVTSADNMVTLVNNILTRHNSLGNNSPLSNQVNTTALANQLQLFIAKRSSCKQQHHDAEANIQQADMALGTEQGQSSKTPGTVYYYVTQVRDRLLFVHKGEEEQLSRYGFNVVISSSGSGGNTPPPPAPTETLVLSTKQNPPASFSIGLLGGNGEEITSNWGDTTSDTITVNENTHTVIQHLYATTGNYTIELTGTANGFWQIVSDHAQHTAINLPDTLTEMREMDFNNNQFTSFFVPTTYTKLIRLQLTNNDIDQQSINLLLTTFNGFGTSNGYIDLSGGTNQAPSGQGIAAKNQLTARGWTVLTN